MPLPAALLLTAALLPLASFALLISIGRRIGNPLAGYVATALVGGSFVCSILAMISWYPYTAAHAWGYGLTPIVLTAHWLPTGSGWLDVGIFVDSVTIALFATVTLVATLVHIFSIGYMRTDGRYPRFFALLGLFCFAMLGLLLGGTLLHILIFWEGVGACSYLLIGFWYEKPQAANAAIKAFVVNRIADIGLLVGIGILLWHVGNLTLPALWATLGHAGGGGPIALADHTTFSAGWLTVAGLGLFCGAIGKSAQFPLHIWLADAMEGPTPVSALIHAATMVAAGVYLLARAFPILTPDAKLAIAIVGAVTLTVGALIALAQTDIKRVLAFSTMSQLGYMVLAIGVGSYVGALFHLVTHAFFKALLFLGAGSVIRAARHEQELPQYGGLGRKIPVTAVTFAVGGLALAGVGFGRFGLGGYFSKDLILSQAGAFASLAVKDGHSRAYYLLFALPAAVAYLTPFYMTRCWTLAFWGRPRNLRLHAGAREHPVMWVPLIVLAILTLISGRLMNVQEMLNGAVLEDTNYCRQINAAFDGFATAWPATADPSPAEAGGAALLGHLGRLEGIYDRHRAGVRDLRRRPGRRAGSPAGAAAAVRPRLAVPPDVLRRVVLRRRGFDGANGVGRRRLVRPRHPRYGGPRRGRRRPRIVGRGWRGRPSRGRRRRPRRDDVGRRRRRGRAAATVGPGAGVRHRPGLCRRAGRRRGRRRRPVPLTPCCPLGRRTLPCSRFCSCSRSSARSPCCWSATSPPPGGRRSASQSRRSP